ncbi:MAG TPA: CocE/NonD family hydrolase [Terriglobales bacterium]|nr:CocE/NonD family hydrolase [Terriglobales bacterium]
MILAALLFFATSLFAQNRNAPPPTRIFEQQNVAVPMRDGVILRADVLRPSESGKFPTLVYRTPYGKDAARREHRTYQHAVERGFAVVIQDVRGRYHSDGEFRPYENEGKDGYDTIEWAAAQPWSNGEVGTFGLSYPGAVQWLAAVENPPHLKAMVPAMTFSTPQNFFYAWGAWDMSWIEWIWDNIAADVRVKKNLPGPRTYEEAFAAWKTEGPKMLSVLPLNAVEQLRAVAPYYFDWLSHPREDPWWNWSELRNKYGRTQAAVLNLSAWYDDNYGPEGATTNYLGLLNARRGKSQGDTHLLLGPWVHGVDNTGKTRSGERDFGRAAAINYDETVLRWMDHYLKGLDNGVVREKPVRYYVMGAEEWRDSDIWPPASHRASFFLSSRQLDSLTLSRSAPEGQAYTEFQSDPANPVVNDYASSGAHDYRKLADRKDVLTFDSEVLRDDTEVTGPILERIFASCDCRDFDLWARLLDVAPDGTACNLMSPGLDVLRGSSRDPAHGRQLLRPGQIYELRLDHLITSNVFRKGHRIRVQISASFFPNFSRNLQTGKSEVTSAEMKKASIRIYHSRKYPSQAILPIVEAR